MLQFSRPMSSIITAALEEVRQNTEELDEKRSYPDIGLSATPAVEKMAEKK